MARAFIILMGFILQGFSLSPAIIPIDKIISGGPSKDGIPALNTPRMVSAELANTWLRDDDRVLGVVVGKQARAYPIRILNWHEIVNDRLAGQPLVVTWCPLCGSGMVFNSDDRFGVSGKLYQSDVLLYDHRTHTLWSQLLQKAVAGERAGESLLRYPVVHTSWQDWFKAHPDTSVLSRHTGFARDYSRNPYAGYETTEALYFNVQHHDNRLSNKAWVMGLEHEGQYRAWSFKAVKKVGELHETWQGMDLIIRYDDSGERIQISRDGKVLHGISLYWFAWAAFHPETGLYR
ncbi:MAG: hypothetical protein COB41_09625 [Proteobacteria bacterium]|nr:MAG: hypothetical protein COB41_09625 [Pseudomonadota bacterium]